MTEISPTGQIFVISAPSGAGKTSLVNAILKRDAGIATCVSHTTRPIRSGELDGENYHFVNSQQFMELVKNEGFVEHATVFGYEYGTSKAALENTINNGSDVILEIDWQGAQQVRKTHTNCKSIFILPPNRSALRSRLDSRGKDSEQVIQSRLDEAASEMAMYKDFDYILVNDEFESALENLLSIINSSRLETNAQSARLGSLIKELTSN